MKAGAPFGSVIAVWEHGYRNDADSLTFTRIAMPKLTNINRMKVITSDNHRDYVTAQPGISTVARRST
jgi:hypothetical protein